MKQIYLHGLGQNPDSWSKVIEQLETAEHRKRGDLPTRPVVLTG